METIIELKNISKNYKLKNKEFSALNKINLMVNKGEFLAVTGPSGSGKTTLMNILGFLDFPDGGTYYFNSEKYNNYNDKSLSKIRNEKIGYIFQSYNLLPSLTAIENVELPLMYKGFYKNNRRDIALKALKTVGLENRINHKPTQLSGGQKQRVAIARAIAINPLLILADEPTGNLDPQTGREILNCLIRLNESGTTIILITHDLETAKLAGRQIEISKGSIIN